MQIQKWGFGISGISFKTRLLILTLAKKHS